MKTISIFLFIFMLSPFLFAQPSNDDCTNTILLATGTSCALTTGTTAGAVTADFDFCTSFDKYNVWYSFNAGSPTQIIHLELGTIANPIIDVYTGGCTFLDPVYSCNFANNNLIQEVTLSGLAIGQNYLISLSNEFISDQGDFQICVKDPPPPPSNDACTNAVVLTSGSTCNLSSGTTLNAVSSDYDPCAEFDKYNVWYTFNASFATHIIHFEIGNITNPIIDVFTNGCSTQTPFYSCNFADNNPVQEVTLSGLIIGQDYLVAISNQNISDQGDFQLCVLDPATPPGNDECNNAISIPMNPSNIPDTMLLSTSVNATQSLMGCSGTADDDVWFSFVATQAKHRLFFKSGTIQFPIVEMFSGTCGSLVSEICSTSGLNTGYGSVLYNNLTIGNAYFVRVYSSSSNLSGSGTFEIGVTSALAINDECSFAISLPTSTIGNANCEQLKLGGNFDATQSMIACSGFSSALDVWYSFTASQAVHDIKLNKLNSTSAFFIEIFSGSCSSLSSLLCKQGNFVQDTAVVKIGNLIAGQTYVFRIFGNNLLYNICVTSPVFPTNNNCETASMIVPSTDETFNFITGTLHGATTSISNFTPCIAFNPLDVLDVWYKFTASSIQHMIKAKRIGSSGSVSFEVYTGTCGTLTHMRCNAANDTIFGIGNLNIGSDYYIRMYNFNTAYDFEIAVNTPIPLANDECQTATQVIPTEDSECNNVIGTLLGSTQSINVDCESQSVGQIRDVWYSFVATQTSHRIRLTKGTAGNIRYHLYEGTCGALNSILCSSQINSGFVENRHNSLTIGNTYYIRVLNESPDANGNFLLCVKSVVIPVNDNCDNASILLAQPNILYASYTNGLSSLEECQAWFGEHIVEEYL